MLSLKVCEQTTKTPAENENNRSTSAMGASARGSHSDSARYAAETRRIEIANGRALPHKKYLNFRIAVGYRLCKRRKFYEKREKLRAVR